MNSLVSQYSLIVASAVFAGSVMLAAWTILQAVTFPKSKWPVSDHFEAERLERVRSNSGVFRWFEPFVRELMRLYDPHRAGVRQLDRQLRLSHERAPWRAAEFLATKNVEGVLSALAIFLLISATGFVGLAATLAVGLLLAYTWMARQSVLSRSRRYMRQFRLRLPFAVDQIALMMQAGAEFEASLQTVVRDNAEHPLGAELGEVLRQVSLGRPRAQALDDLRRRLDDKDVSELVFAINKGQELGTPLSMILREQADQMRLKRSQWGEKAAQEAQVQMVFPGMLVMVACLIVIIAPILLPAIMMFLES